MSKYGAGLKSHIQRSSQSQPRKAVDLLPSCFRTTKEIIILWNLNYLLQWDMNLYASMNLSATLEQIVKIFFLFSLIL